MESNPLVKSGNRTKDFKTFRENAVFLREAHDLRVDRFPFQELTEGKFDLHDSPILQFPITVANIPGGKARIRKQPQPEYAAQLGILPIDDLSVAGINQTLNLFRGRRIRFKGLTHLKLSSDVENTPKRTGQSPWLLFIL